MTICNLAYYLFEGNLLVQLSFKYTTVDSDNYWIQSTDIAIHV